MKNKLFYIMGACVLIAALALGLSGSLVLADEDAAEVPAADRLVGVLVTKEPLDLFDAEAFFSDHASQIMNGGEIEGDTSAYEGRLYATVNEETVTSDDGQTYTRKTYSFGDTDGIEYFYTQEKDGINSCTAAYGNEAVTDGSSSFNYTDDGSDIQLNGVIYVTPSSTANMHWTFNPIYQAADGSVYAVSGESFSMSGNETEGSAYTHTLSSTYQETVNGKTTTDTVSVAMTIKTMFAPTRIRVLQFDENGALLSSGDYTPGVLPDTLAPAAGCAYLVVETFKQGPDDREIMTPALIGSDADSFDTYYTRAKDGVCLKQTTTLDWGGSQTGGDV